MLDARAAEVEGLASELGDRGEGDPGELAVRGLRTETFQALWVLGVWVCDARESDTFTRAASPH